MKLLLTSIITLLCLCGCRSAEDAFNDGRQAELSGNNQRAISYYIEAIRLKPELLDATTRLETVGEKHMSSIIDRAQQDINQKRGFAGLTQLTKAEALKRQLNPYTANVKLPSHFAKMRVDAQQIVISNRFSDASNAERSAKWDEALGYLSEINQYNPTSSQRLQLLKSQTRIKDIAFKQELDSADRYFSEKKWQAALDGLKKAKKYADNLSEDQLLSERSEKFKNGVIIQEATALKGELDRKDWPAAENRIKRLDTLNSSLDKRQQDAIRLLKGKVYNSWATDLFKQRKYRESWHRSADVLKYDPDNQEAVNRQTKARKLGTQNFLLLPIIHSNQSKNLAWEVNSSFNNGPARNMPPFTALVKDFDLQEAIRAFKVDPQRMTRNQAVAIARRTQANFVIFREITLYRIEQQFTSKRTEIVKLNVPPQAKPPKNQGNNPPQVQVPTTTKIEIKKGNLILKGTIRFSVIDDQTGHSLFSEEGKIDSVLEFEQAFPDRPLKDLILTEKQNSLLEPPGNAKDLLQLEKSAAATATDFFLKTVLPKLEVLVP
jgi:hypothetical protein